MSSPMLDVRLEIEKFPKQSDWRVRLESTVAKTIVDIPPITDADLEHVPELPARSWREVVDRLRPGRGLSRLHLVHLGELLRKKLLPSSELEGHLLQLEMRRQKQSVQLRFILDVLDNGDCILADLPLELLHYAQGFFFRQMDRLSLRGVPSGGDAYNLRIKPGATVLLVTAHADFPNRPTRDELDKHALALQKILEEHGFLPRPLLNANRESLKSALLAAPVDVLYIACHGMEDPSGYGSLVLRDGRISGSMLGEYIKETREKHGRPVQVAMLCACSSAVPQAERGTSGMAQWLARPGFAKAALGFRGPVEVDWALEFSKQLFSYLGQGYPLEYAFTRARMDTDDDDPQWVLPLLYGRPQDYVELLKTSETPRPRSALDSANMSKLRSIMPRKHRPFFTGRQRDLAELQDWMQQPNTTQIIGLEGGAGIGKTELACYAVHTWSSRDWTVFWLESPERDLRGALTTLIQSAQPGFVMTPDHTIEDLAQLMRDRLAEHRGLLVLDDVSDPLTVQKLQPNGDWKVLFTTRVQRLMPGVDTIHLEPLPPKEALELFCRVAFDQSHPPDREEEEVKRLVERLGSIPLALELSAAVLRRDGLTSQGYLEELLQNEGTPSETEQEVFRILLSPLKKLPPADRRVFFCLSIFPAVGVAVEQVATATSETELQVTRQLDRMKRYHLIEVAPERDRYRMHQLLRTAARNRARQEGNLWDDLHAGVAAAMEKLAEWTVAEQGTRVDRSLLRWRQVRDLFDSLDVTGWRHGARGGAEIAAALAYADLFRRLERTPAERAQQLDLAVSLLPPEGEPKRRANVLEARGDLRLRQADLEHACEDYDAAMALYETLGSREGQANVRKARGDLLLRKGELTTAVMDYDTALSLYKAAGSNLGQANVLKARGDVWRRQDKLEDASRDYSEALTLYGTVESRQGQANVLQAAGDLRRKQNNPMGASQAYDAALNLYREVEDRLGQANVLLMRADLRRARGDFQGASQDYDNALAFYEAIEDRQGRANIHLARGNMEASRTNWAGAERWYLEAISLFEAARDLYGQANAWAQLARATLRLGQPELAKNRADQALRLAATCENRHAERLARRLLDDLQPK